MSKVKIGYTNAHEKSKLRHQLRRKETMKKKVDRINNCSHITNQIVFLNS